MKTPQATPHVNLLKATLVALLIFNLQIARSQTIPLPNAFAHNDYRHRHPLFDALQNGYTNIEADIFLRRGKLIVAHIDPYFKSSRTLEALYLKPLADRIAANKGLVYQGYTTPIILMIDVKTGSDDTYAVLEKVLEKYKSMLSSYDHGQVRQGVITVVLSGHKPYQMIKDENNRVAFIDEDLRKTYQDTSAVDVYQMSSCKYKNLLKWKGDGAMPVDQQQKLCSYVSEAHKYGKKVRLYAAPENDNVWTALLKCGVDLINTDKLARLKNFLMSHKPSLAVVANTSTVASNERTVVTL